MEKIEVQQAVHDIFDAHHASLLVRPLLGYHSVVVVFESLEKSLEDDGEERGTAEALKGCHEDAVN